MIRPIVQFGHPSLRAKGRRIEKIDEKVQELVDDLIETMRSADGVGLAAQQVGVPLLVCVVDITGIADRPSSMEVNGQTVDPDNHMPLVLINPEVEPIGKNRESGTEGCLSFPGIQAEIERPSRIAVRATLRDGNHIEFTADGLLGRAIQHEEDHLQGVLFIDRMTPDDRKRLAGGIDQIARKAGADFF